MPVSWPVRPFRQIWSVMRSVKKENVLMANQTQIWDADVDVALSRISPRVRVRDSVSIVYRIAPGGYSWIWPKVYWRRRNASLLASQISTKQHTISNYAAFTLETSLRLPVPSICARKSYIIYWCCQCLSSPILNEVVLLAATTKYYDNDII